MVVNLTILPQTTIAQTNFNNYNNPFLGFNIDVPVNWQRIEYDFGVLFFAPSTDNNIINIPARIFIDIPMSLSIPYSNELVNQIKNVIVNYYSNIKNNFIEMGFVDLPLPGNKDGHLLIYSYDDEVLA
jgi:hypothetical protein